MEQTKMRIAVLGATGMAGHVVCLYFKERGYDVTAISRRPFTYVNNNILLDVHNTSELENTLLKGDFFAVINCIGILNQYAENNKDEAIYLNSYLPHYLAKILRNTDTRLIQMSTDCVFSGETGGYLENSLTDGKSYYDRTKALGEINDKKNLTFRNSIIGPDMQENGIGLFNWFMKQDKPIEGYSKAIWTGVTTLTLAKAMDTALQNNITGLYNLVNNKNISKLELLKLFNKYFRENSIQISENDKVVIDKSLINTRTDVSFHVPDYEIMIAEMKIWIDEHKDLYPHYFNGGIRHA